MKNKNFDRKDYWKLIAFLTVFYTLWKFLKYLNFLWLFKNNIPSFGELFNPNDYLLILFLDWLAVILFMSAIAYLVAKWLNLSKLRPLTLIPMHLAFSMLIGFAIFPTLLFGYWLQGSFSFDPDFWSILIDRVIKYMDVNFLTYFSMLGIILLFYYFKNLEQQKERESQIKSMLYEARLQSINSQLEPHFIFNVLHGVCSLIDEDKKKAKKLLCHFGDMLRAKLTKKNLALIPLHAELNSLENYIEILKIRFQEDLRITIHFDQELENILVPNLILQPLVENSVKHGYGYDIKKLIVKVTIKLDDNRVLLRVENNGESLNPKSSQIEGQGNGLRIIRERLEIQYGDNFCFRINNLKNAGVENLIKIPIQKENSISIIQA